MVLQHFRQSVWKSLDTPGMIDTPDLDSYIFCRTLLPHAIDQVDEVNATMIVPFRSIQNALEKNKVELIM
jgi:hypothetical protein